MLPWIDTSGAPSVHFRGFVTPASGCSFRAAASATLLAAIMGGCSSPAPDSSTEDSHTSGRIRVVCVPDLEGLIVRQREAFQTLYPGAVIEIRAASSRDAITALYAAEADLAVTGRELEPEERDAAVQAGLELQGYRFARDALVIIVNPENPVENLSVNDLRGIYRGEVSLWSDLGGTAAPIAPVVQPPGSDLTNYLVQELLEGKVPATRAIHAESDSEVVATVLRERGAIGYVSLSGGREDARPLRVAPITGLSYWKPDLEAVYKGDYPLTRYHTMFVRADGARLAHGFITFVTSIEGQRLVQDAGLVPTTVPVRFVRRSPMISTHE